MFKTETDFAEKCLETKDEKDLRRYSKEDIFKAMQAAITKEEMQKAVTKKVETQEVLPTSYFLKSN